MKRVDLSWVSIAPQALRWRRFLTLNSLPICLTEGQAVLLFFLLSSSPILQTCPDSPPLLAALLVSPFSFFPSSSYKLSTIFTFSLLPSLTFKLFFCIDFFPPSIACTNLSDLTSRKNLDLLCYQCLMLVPVLPVQMAVRRCNLKHCVPLGYVFDLFWLIVMACFCLGGSWPAMSNRDFNRAGDVSFFFVLFYIQKLA